MGGAIGVFGLQVLARKLLGKPSTQRFLKLKFAFGPNTEAQKLVEKCFLGER